MLSQETELEGGFGTQLGHLGYLRGCLEVVLGRSVCLLRISGEGGGSEEGAEGRCEGLRRVSARPKNRKDECKRTMEESTPPATRNLNCICPEP